MSPRSSVGRWAAPSGTAQCSFGFGSLAGRLRLLVRDDLRLDLLGTKGATALTGAVSLAVTVWVPAVPVAVATLVKSDLTLGRVQL